MRHQSHWTVTVTLAAGLVTGAWAQHGGGVHGGSGHESHDFAADSATHSSAASSTHGSGANFESRLSNNTSLSSRLQPLLPAGETLQAAATGFKNRGQFIAALHVSQNLKIPFDQLKSDMTGTNHDSLGEAIHELRPELTSKLVKNNVKLAENQTKTDIEESHEASETSGR
ncbi:MAG TPA: hypothetical protein VKT49_20640 [Bryobacteraceae bacterium]|nr:hypothetical protein [Bryobacteraceae bacterium]